MQYGINIAPGAESWKVVRRAEELGFDHAWFIDSQLINADLFVSMTAAAMKTSHIRLGTGVLVPSNRLAPVAANALASLNALAPGRIEFGVGTGFTGRRTMGMGPLRLNSLFYYVDVVERLLAGQTVDYTIEGETHQIRFMNPELGLINLKDRIPINISAFGPRGRRMTAERGYGWTNSVGSLERARTAIDGMKASWAAAGRNPADLVANANCGGAVVRRHGDWDADYVREQAGPSAAMLLHNLAEKEAFGSITSGLPPRFEGLQDAYAEIYRAYEPHHARYLSNHKNHLMLVRPEERHLISGDFIRETTLSGTRDELREKIQALAAMGYTRLSVHVRTVLPSMMEDWADVFERV